MNEPAEVRNMHAMFRDGKRYTTAGAPFWSNTFFASTISDDKFKRSLQVLDYMLSDEYRILGINGIENVDFKVEKGQYVSLLKAGETLADKYSSMGPSMPIP